MVLQNPESSEGPKALIVGASGLVGRVVLRLCGAGEGGYQEVTAIVRKPLRDAPPNVKVQIVDFEALPGLPLVRDVYCALGTTIKTAGSEEAFRHVDYDHVMSVARAAKQAGAKHFLVVSAYGADASARMFYNRVKGEMERDVAKIGFANVTIAQPSLLLGDRESLGQASRPGERIGTALLKPLSWLLPASVKPIPAASVARALIRTAVSVGAQSASKNGSVVILSSADLLRLGKEQ